MAEYIEKETVIANLIEQIEKGRDTAECEATELVIKRFAEYIGSFPAADVQPVDRWISVDDRLPEIGKSVLIYYPKWDGDEIQVAKLDSDGMTFDICGEFNIGTGAVTHWQTLPEPPTNKI